jgi:hypothetical protein
MKFIAFLLAMTASLCAQSATISATDYTNVVVGEDQGTANDRNNADNILGDADGQFYELGKGGSIDLTFGVPFTGPAMVVEVTFGNPASWPESFDVFVGFDGVFDFIGNVSNTDAAVTGAIIEFAGVFNSLRLVDTTAASTPGGGADIDSVSVTPVARISQVPLPGAAWLFLSAVAGGVGIKRIRSKKS